jgi:hypothetical protein
MRRRARDGQASLGRMNLPVTRAPACMRRHLILGCVALLALLGLAARAVVALEETPAEPARHSSLLKAILEPWFALRDGKDPLQDSEYRQTMRAQWRLSTEARYFHLVRKLDLPPDLTERLYDLLVDQIFESLDNPTYSVSTPESLALKRKQEGELAALIGEHRLAQFQEYEETFEYRNEVTRLQLHFVQGIDVLRDDQVDAMIAIMRDADRQMQRAMPTAAEFAGAAEVERQPQHAKTHELRLHHDAHILEAAAAVLTPAQLAALDASFRRERVHRELLEIAYGVVPVGKTAVARIRNTGPGYFLVGANDDRLVRDPDYRRVWHTEKRLEVESTYVDVPGLLKLSPELMDRFFSLLVSQQLRRVEMPTNSASGYEDRMRQEERELTALLGESNYARFREFQDSYTERHQVKDLKIAIGADIDSLREDQVEKLILILRDANEEMQRAGPASHFIFMTKAMRQRQMELARQRDARVREKAAPLLTPRQFAALDAWVRFELSP